LHARSPGFAEWLRGRCRVGSDGRFGTEIPADRRADVGRGGRSVQRWVLLVWYHALVPWYVMMPVGAYLIAWHFSLQHEAIHSFRGVPKWLRFAVVFRRWVCGFLSVVSQEPSDPSPR